MKNDHFRVWSIFTTKMSEVGNEIDSAETQDKKASSAMRTSLKLKINLDRFL